jgi:hypothetical protein
MDLSKTFIGRSYKRLGPLNGQERLGTNSGKRSRSRFKNQRNTVKNTTIKNLIFYISNNFETLKKKIFRELKKALSIRVGNFLLAGI